MELLSGFGKQGVKLNLLSKPADVIDTGYLSAYFVFQEFSPKLTAGKNSITFNGSTLLKQGSEVLVECIDSVGVPLYIESTTKTSLTYREASSYILSIHVYAEISNGPGKLILYGTLNTGATVKWVGDIIIDKTKQNISTVRFYETPVLDITSVLSPVISNADQYTTTVNLTGSFYSYASDPQKDKFITDKRNIDVDYRLYAINFPSDIDPSGSINSQIIGSDIDLYVETIQEPYSGKNIDVFLTSSFRVKDVLNNTTIKISDAFTYADKNNNDVIVNITKGKFSIDYQYIIYNENPEDYLVINVEVPVVVDGITTTATENVDKTVQTSYANIVYRNLKTFSGFIARHKLYKKSLFTPSDFEIIADEPLYPYELLQDKNTANKAFSSLGQFYNQYHIDRYITSAGSKLSLNYSANRLSDGMDIVCSGNNSDLNSFDNYVIFKNNTGLDRGYEYVAYDENEFMESSGSSYDCNFIDIKKDVNYVLSVNAIVKKDATTINDIDAGLEFYFTSSLAGINNQQNSVHLQKGLLKLGVVSAAQNIPEKVYANPVQILFSSNCDLYGTLIIVPYKCNAIISKLSIKPYGDFGFSPDTLITRIPFPVQSKNESFEIKSELFDVNSNIVYSDLKTTVTFDKDGDSLYSYILGLKDPANIKELAGSLDIKGGLIVGDATVIEKTLTINGAVYLSTIIESEYNSSDRMLTLDGVNKSIRYTNINDINTIGTEELDIKLAGKGSSLLSTLTNYRLIPSIKGRNISVLKESTETLPPADPLPESQLM